MVQINVVVFSTDRSRPAEEQAPAPGEPWVVPSTEAEMMGHFVGWGPKVLNLLAVGLPATASLIQGADHYHTISRN